MASAACGSAHDFCLWAVPAHDLFVVLKVVVHVVEVSELVQFPLDVQKQQALDPAQRPVAPPAQDEG